MFNILMQAKMVNGNKILFINGNFAGAYIKQKHEHFYNSEYKSNNQILNIVSQWANDDISPAPVSYLYDMLTHDNIHDLISERLSKAITNNMLPSYI